MSEREELLRAQQNTKTISHKITHVNVADLLSSGAVLGSCKVARQGHVAGRETPLPVEVGGSRRRGGSGQGRRGLQSQTRQLWYGVRALHNLPSSLRVLSPPCALLL